MEKIKDAGARWIPTAINVLIAVIVLPYLQDVRTHTTKLAAIEERLMAEPKVHELVTEQLKGWTREQVAASLAEVQRELREMRVEIRQRTKANAQP